MSKIIYHNLSYKIIGKCFEVHKHLGPGFLEIVYKDALEREFFTSGVTYGREQEYEVVYKGQHLKHKFFADFVVFDKIILEVKAVDGFTEVFYAQCINYLKVSGMRLALLINFGQTELQIKRFIL